MIGLTAALSATRWGRHLQEHPVKSIASGLDHPPHSGVVGLGIVRRIECRNRGGAPTLLHDDVTGEVDRRLKVLIDAAVPRRRAPRAHDQILALVARFGTQQSSDVHLGDDREALTLQCKAGAQDGLVVAFWNLHRVSVVTHAAGSLPSKSRPALSTTVTLTNDGLEEPEVHALLLLAVPNISEGGDGRFIAECAAATQLGGARLLDLHSDPAHNRSVLTVSGHPAELVAGMTELATVATAIDMSAHRGLHPRLGGLDVCPFIPFEATMADAVTVARTTAMSIAKGTETPVYLYGEAATRPETRELPDLRRGGLSALAERAGADLPPDRGPKRIDLHRGVVCVGARGPLIAFNVWLAADRDVAQRIASEVRKTGTLRALGMQLAPGTSQVSMNLTQPHVLGIDEAFDLVAASAARLGARVTSTEIVGLVAERFLPAPDATATRLLSEPGRSVESVLRLES